MLKINGLLRLWRSLNIIGLLLGTLFFAGSLTPSLLPRTEMTQGILSGCALACGYALGVLASMLWTFMQIPQMGIKIHRYIKYTAILFCLVILCYFLWQTGQWQNAIRELMQLPPVEKDDSVQIAGIALLSFTVLIALFKLCFYLVRTVSQWLGKYLPLRTSWILGTFFSLVLFWSVVNGVIFRFALHAIDSTFGQLDRMLVAEVSRPEDPMQSGSRASLLQWDELGRMGRAFIHDTPSAETITRTTGRAARKPQRVYVGLPAAETAQERARLALEELIRIGGFERKYLVIVTPTGTGWIDPGGIASIEYLTHGDIASVAIQYSYLLSWLSLLIEPEYGIDASQALFQAVYQHWHSLPREQRPKLYLHGLSLGSYNSEQSAQLYEVLSDPYHGALWSGPTFNNPLWRYFTAHRNPGSPQWLPVFRDSDYVRFMNQKGLPENIETDNGRMPMRILYLQYASDPISFFDYRILYQEPDWMNLPRGPDVSAELRWYPIVTFLQLAVDVGMADTVPVGYGHVFAPHDYVAAWMELIRVPGWSPEQLTRLGYELDKLRH